MLQGPFLSLQHQNLRTRSFCCIPSIKSMKQTHSDASIASQLSTLEHLYHQTYGRWPVCLHFYHQNWVSSVKKVFQNNVIFNRHQNSTGLSTCAEVFHIIGQCSTLHQALLIKPLIIFSFKYRPFSNIEKTGDPTKQGT